jgi:hypothetical protein
VKEAKSTVVMAGHVDPNGIPRPPVPLLTHTINATISSA